MQSPRPILYPKKKKHVRRFIASLRSAWNSDAAIVAIEKSCVFFFSRIEKRPLNIILSMRNVQDTIKSRR